MRRNILVTGATGKQGSGLIRALLHPEAPDAEHQYHIYAVTRKASSPGATHLQAEENVTVIEGNLDDRESITKIFQDAKSDGGIWGVYACLAFPGLGMSADGEERQGKTIADLALEFGVSAFIYTSAARSGPKYEDQLKLSWLAKSRIEQHCMSLGEKGLPWTILRPGFFMENFDEFIGSIAVSMLKSGLKPDTTVGLIASEDIGNVGAGVFREHERFNHQILVLLAEFLTMGQLGDSYKKAMGKSIPAAPIPMAWIITKLNKSTQDLIYNIELNHSSRKLGEYPELEGEIRAANSAYRMRTYHDWILQGQKQNTSSNGDWNKVSLGKLLTGRS